MKYRYTFRLKTGRDEDLISWLKGMGDGERSFFIRQTLRRGLDEPVRAAPRIQFAEPLPRQEIPEIADDDIESRLDRLAGGF